MPTPGPRLKGRLDLQVERVSSRQGDQQGPRGASGRFTTERLDQASNETAAIVPARKTEMMLDIDVNHANCAALRVSSAHSKKADDKTASSTPPPTRQPWPTDLLRRESDGTIGPPGPGPLGIL